jgi:hypothetical protein
MQTFCRNFLRTLQGPNVHWYLFLVEFLYYIDEVLKYISTSAEVEEVYNSGLSIFQTYSPALPPPQPSFPLPLEVFLLAVNVWPSECPSREFFTGFALYIYIYIYNIQSIYTVISSIYFAVDPVHGPCWWHTSNLFLQKPKKNRFAYTYYVCIGTGTSHLLAARGMLSYQKVLRLLLLKAKKTFKVRALFDTLSTPDG